MMDSLERRAESHFDYLCRSPHMWWWTGDRGLYGRRISWLAVHRGRRTTLVYVVRSSSFENRWSEKSRVEDGFDAEGCCSEDKRTDGGRSVEGGAVGVLEVGACMKQVCIQCAGSCVLCTGKRRALRKCARMGHGIFRSVSMGKFFFFPGSDRRGVFFLLTSSWGQSQKIFLEKSILAGRRGSFVAAQPAPVRWFGVRVRRGRGGRPSGRGGIDDGA